jgi:hypothetical protein
MKNRKWLTYTLGILLTLVVLTAVAGAGFRIGMTQNASFARPAFARNFDGNAQSMRGNFQDNGGPQAMMQGNPHGNGGYQAMQGNSRNQGFNSRGGDRRDGRMSFLSPIFGLIRLVVLGLLVWIGYKFVKKSGWRLSRVQASAAPVVNEPPVVEVEEEKPAE